MGKVVLITGGSSGIGKCIGDFLNSKGFVVFGTSRNPKYVVESSFSIIEMDVRDQNSVRKGIQEVITKAGTIDILINNAGVGITGALEEIPMEEVKNNFETNLFGPICVMQEVLPFMRNNRSGLIINITSIAGYMGLPYRSVYSASKGALELITEALRMEVRPFGIEITNVAPGDFATNIAAGRYHAPLNKTSDYGEVYSKILATMNEHVDHGAHPNQMALAVYNIINKRNPKIHYKVGSFLQKFSIVLKRLLPDKMYENMLLKHYGLK